MPSKKKKTKRIDNDPNIADFQPKLEDPRGGFREKRYIRVNKAEQYWIEKARQDPIFFQHYMTGMDPPAHHRIWLRTMFHPDKKRNNFIAPRESGKTICFTNATAWRIGKRPWETNGILSVGADQSEKRLDVIKGYIEYNPRYRNVFPDVFIDDRKTNTKREFSVWSSLARNGNAPVSYNIWRMIRNRISDDKDPTLFGVGRGSSTVIGKRINGFLLLDDIIDDKDLTPEAQLKVVDYIMQTLIPCVTEQGSVANIGTRWMTGDVPETLKQNPVWNTIDLPGILEDDNGEKFSYWEDFWPLDKLERKREEMNNDMLFRIMYLNDPRASSAELFTVDSLSRPLPPTLPPLIGIYIGIDLAISKRTRADYNFFSAVGVDRNQNLYWLASKRIKGPPSISVPELFHLRDLVEHKYGTRVTTSFCENVAYQAAFMDAVVSQDPTFPITPYTPKGDKDMRLSILSRIAMQGRFYVNKQDPNYQTFYSECLNYPARYDDGPDSVSIICQALNLGSSRPSEMTMFTPEGLLW